MIRARFLPRWACRWLRNRRMRKWQRIRAKDKRKQVSRGIVRYFVTFHSRSTFR